MNSPSSAQRDTASAHVPRTRFSQATGMRTARPVWRHWRLVTAFVMLFVMLFPFLWLVQMAFRPADSLFDLTLFFRPTFDAFKELWHGDFRRSLLNSLTVSILSTALSLLFGVPAAYGLARCKFRWRRSVALWILTTRMAPPIAFTIPFFLAYRWLGLQDTIAGLVIVYLTFNLAIVIWLMQTFFESVPKTLEEAAFIDGCGIWQAFWHVTLPLAAPGLAATSVLCFIFSWNDFFYALILTRTRAITAPVAIVNFLQYQGWEWSKVAAAGAVVMLPVVLFTIVTRTWLVRGLTAGGVKE